MPLPHETTGKGSDAKLIKYNLPSYEGDFKLKFLSVRMVDALLKSIIPLDWIKRHDTLPDDINNQLLLSDYADKVRKYLMTDVNFCEQMINCINNDEDTGDALYQWLLDRGFNPSVDGAVPDSYANQNAYGQALGCDDDDGFGHIRYGLIERSFQRTIDVLERIAVVNDNEAMLAEFVNSIPGIGAFFDVIPVTDWIQFFDNVRDWMLDQFEAADTLDLRDEIACDLFCIWQQNCSLTNKQIRDYYWNKTRQLVPAWGDAFNSFVELGYALSQLSLINFGNAVVYALVGSQYGFLTFLNNWFGVRIEVTRNDLALGQPSNEWMTLCDTCPIDYCDDFTPEIGELSWEIGEDYPYATWNVCDDTYDGQIAGGLQAGLGIDGGNAIVGVIVCTEGQTIAEAGVVVDFEEEVTINSVSMQHLPYQVNGGNRQYIRFLDDTATEVYSITQEGSNVEAWHTYAATVETAGIRYVVFSNTQNGGAPRIGQICVNYTPPG